MGACIRAPQLALAPSHQIMVGTLSALDLGERNRVYDAILFSIIIIIIIIIIIKFFIRTGDGLTFDVDSRITLDSVRSSSSGQDHDEEAGVGMDEHDRLI